MDALLDQRSWWVPLFAPLLLAELEEVGPRTRMLGIVTESEGEDAAVVSSNIVTGVSGGPGTERASW